MISRNLIDAILPVSYQVVFLGSTSNNASRNIRNSAYVLWDF